MDLVGEGRDLKIRVDILSGELFEVLLDLVRVRA
jgi:hypothetical protein